MAFGRHLKLQNMVVLGVLLWACGLGPLGLAWGQSPAQAAKEEERQLAYNQNRSTISFLVSSTLHPIRGKATKFDGRVVVPSAADPSSGSVTLEIEAVSLDSGHEGRDRKMRDGVLEVNRFPAIRFRSTEIRNGSKSDTPGRGERAEIVGILDLHGVQKRISIPVEYMDTREGLQVKGRLKIKRSDFQIPEPRFLFLRVADEIEIDLDIRATPLSNPL